MFCIFSLFKVTEKASVWFHQIPHWLFEIVFAWNKEHKTFRAVSGLTVKVPINFLSFSNCLKVVQCCLKVLITFGAYRELFLTLFNFGFCVNIKSWDIKVTLSWFNISAFKQKKIYEVISHLHTFSLLRSSTFMLLFLPSVTDALPDKGHEILLIKPRDSLTKDKLLIIYCTTM